MKRSARTWSGALSRAVVLVAWFLCFAAEVAAARPWFSDVFAPPVPQQPHPAVVRVIAPEDNGSSLGSGTLIDVRDGYGLVVTNWHVVRDATGPIEVRFPGGHISRGVVHKVDSDWDLAAVAIEAPPGVAPVRLAARPPREGEPLTIAGYGSGAYRAQTGTCTQFLAPSPRHPFEMVEVNVPARQGDSGGPILNASGELAGVLFGEGGGSTSGSHCGRLRMFLTGVLPPATSTPAVDSPGEASTTAIAGLAAADPFQAAVPAAGAPKRDPGPNRQRIEPSEFPSEPTQTDATPRFTAESRSSLASGRFAPLVQPKLEPIAVERPAGRDAPRSDTTTEGGAAIEFDWAPLVMRIGVVFAGLLVLRSLGSLATGGKK